MHLFSSRADLAVWIASLAICLAALGCGNREPAGTVRGKVDYKGKPVESGSIVFFPNDGPVSSGKLQPDGSFQLLNYAKDEGLPPGEYTIAVIAGTDQINLRPDDPSFRVEPTIPLKFTSKSLSPLRYDVQIGPNEIHISLDEPPSIKRSSKQ